jgi:hypothetical protein
MFYSEYKTRIFAILILHDLNLGREKLTNLRLPEVTAIRLHGCAIAHAPQRIHELAKTSVT